MLLPKSNGSSSGYGPRQIVENRRYLFICTKQQSGIVYCTAYKLIYIQLNYMITQFLCRVLISTCHKQLSFQYSAFHAASDRSICCLPDCNSLQILPPNFSFLVLVFFSLSRHKLCPFCYVQFVFISTSQGSFLVNGSTHGVGNPSKSAVCIWWPMEHASKLATR